MNSKSKALAVLSIFGVGFGVAVFIAYPGFMWIYRMHSAGGKGAAYFLAGMLLLSLAILGHHASNLTGQVFRGEQETEQHRFLAKAAKVVLLGYAFILLLIVLPSRFFGSRPQDPASTERMLQIKMEGMVPYYVEKRLKVPSSASFDRSTRRFEKVGKYYFISGEVEAQNSFGVMLRSRYIVQFSMRGDEPHVENVTVEAR